MSDYLPKYVVDDSGDWLRSDHPIYQELLRRSWEILAREPDPVLVPNNRYNKRINTSFDGYDVLIRGKRRGDVDISVSPPGSDKWIFTFKHGVEEKAVLSSDLAESVVLPALQRLMVLEDLADV